MWIHLLAHNWYLCSLDQLHGFRASALQWEERAKTSAAKSDGNHSASMANAGSQQRKHRSKHYIIVAAMTCKLMQGPKRVHDVRCI